MPEDILVHLKCGAIEQFFNGLHVPLFNSNKEGVPLIVSMDRVDILDDPMNPGKELGAYKRVVRPIEEVSKLIMGILEGHGTPEMLEELRRRSVGHTNCSLGSTPACDCGGIEAWNFLKIFDGRMNGAGLIRHE